MLRQEPYRGADLDAQLKDQVQRLLADPTQFRLDPETHELGLSAVFNWFGEDFEPSYTESDPYPGMNARQTAVLNFLASSLPADNASLLHGGNLTASFLDWYWNLNDQPAPLRRLHDEQSHTAPGGCAGDHPGPREATCIGAVVRELLALEVRRIRVIDSGSVDGSAEQDRQAGTEVLIGADRGIWPGLLAG